MFKNKLTNASLAKYVGGVYEESRVSLYAQPQKGVIASITTEGFGPFRKLVLEIWPSEGSFFGGRARSRVTIPLWSYGRSLTLDKCLVLRSWMTEGLQVMLYPSIMRTDLLERWLDMPAPEGVE